MSNNEKFKEALSGKKIGPLTLDNKWYKLFKQAVKTKEIERLEESQKELLKEQGRINSERGKLKALKTKLMDEIVEFMESKDKKAEKKKEKNSKLIDEINEKLEANEDRGLDLPKEIDDINKELMLLTMEQCYDVIQENTAVIDELSEDIKNLRIELKKLIVQKQQREFRNVEIYSYMNDIFGPKVVEIFDIKYDIEEKKQEIIQKQREAKEKKEFEQNLKPKPDGSV